MPNHNHGSAGQAREQDVCTRTGSVQRAARSAKRIGPLSSQAVQELPTTAPHLPGRRPLPNRDGVRRALERGC